MLTPRYEYSQSVLQMRAEELLALKAPYGLTVRYAVKANMFPAIIDYFTEAGIQFDASSSYESVVLLERGVPGKFISLSSQQSPHNLSTLLDSGVQFVATSLNQLERFLAETNRPDTVGVRINPPMGYGFNNRTTTGGVNSSFGIWHEYIPEVLERVRAAKVIVDRVHLHVGSGADSAVWGNVMDVALHIMELFPDAITLDIGGGFKVSRYVGEEAANLSMIMSIWSEKLRTFAEETGRTLKLEIEPGAYLVAAAGTLVASVDDIVDTGANGYQFLRLNAGMNDFLRTALYGAQHRIEVCNNSTEYSEYIVVGHCCESGDLLTPAPGDPESMKTRLLKTARIGDEVRIFDVGAYGASMRARGYNAFPDAQELLVP